MISDVIGKKVLVMKVFFIFIKYLKDLMIERMNLQILNGNIFVKDIDFIFIILVKWGEKVRSIMEGVVIEVRIYIFLIKFLCVYFNY